jgi:hypothetical protein
MHEAQDGELVLRVALEGEHTELVTFVCCSGQVRFSMARGPHGDRQLLPRFLAGED